MADAGWGEIGDPIDIVAPPAPQEDDDDNEIIHGTGSLQGGT